MRDFYDVIIVGSGPAGMFAANELLNKKLRILIIDSGKPINRRRCPMEITGKCINCEPCDIMCGVGGAGTFSDGTLNLRPDIGGDLTEFTGNLKEAYSLVEEVDKTFLRFGMSKKLSGTNEKDVIKLRRKAASSGIKFVDIPQRHMGTDKAPKIIGRFERHLRKKGVEFLLQTRVKSILIENGKSTGVKLEKGRKINARFILIAPGRSGASWFDKEIEKHGIRAEFGPIDVGVRVEVSSIIMDSIIGVNRDPKFHIRTKRYDDFVRTFCTNDHGYVVTENYDGMVGVNGHSFVSRSSENTNFAFLVRVSLTKPLENTIKYGESIAKLSTTIGGGKPILQRLGDLRRGRRSHKKGILQNPIQPTLMDVTPGDISMALPHRVVMDIIEGLEKLNEVIPGVTSDSTLLYAPEIKFYTTQVKVNEGMETSIKNLFAAGDGAGLSRDIVNSAATGILAGRGILSKVESQDS